MSNYPDNIRDFDHHPQSPFYEEDYCDECEHPLSDCICNEETEDGTDTTE